MLQVHSFRSQFSVVGDVLFTFAGLNGATSIAEKIDTKGVDVVVGIARCVLLAECGGDINIQLNSPQEKGPAQQSTLTGQRKVWKSLAESGT